MMIETTLLIGGLLCGVSGLSNIALHKPTKSSSALLSVSSNAVDGNLSPIWTDEGCFHVDECDLYPWWQVDLEQSYEISQLKVVTRQECCTTRFHDISVETFKDDPTVNSLTESGYCNFYKGPPATDEGVITIDCSPGPVTGRYVRLSGKAKQNSLDIMQFCEVQIFGIPAEANRAVNKPTKSSSAMESKPERAVDGKNSSTDWSSWSCFQTATCDKFPWWQVDLQADFCISKVEIVTLSDSSSDRFRDVAVEVYQSDPTLLNAMPPTQVCTKYEGGRPGPGETVILPCTQPVSGRYVRIAARSVSNDLLQFCEVRVFASNSSCIQV